MASGDLFKCAWGGVELWLANIETDEGRDIVVSKYAAGNSANVQNRGGVPRVARCSILFDDFKGQEEDGRDRLEHLIALKESGEPQLFVHPIQGTYLAEIGEFTYSIDSSGVISGSATFTPVEDRGAVTVYPVGVTIDGGTPAINARADDVDATMADAGLSSDVSGAARATASIFEAGSSTRDTLVALGDISARINQEIFDKAIELDIALWPAMKAFVMLADATLDAANAVTGDSSGIMTMMIQRPTSLRRLCADLYGGGGAEEGYDEALQLNDIPTPARIPTGTQLRMRQPGTF